MLHYYKLFGEYFLWNQTKNGLISSVGKKFDKKSPKTGTFCRKIPLNGQSSTAFVLFFVVILIKIIP